MRKLIGFTTATFLFSGLAFAAPPDQALSPDAAKQATSPPAKPADQAQQAGAPTPVNIAALKTEYCMRRDQLATQYIAFLEQALADRDAQLAALKTKLEEFEAKGGKKN